MITERQIKSLTKAIDKFNAELAEYFKATEDESLPSVDCTFISCDPVQLYTYKVMKTMVKVTDCDGEEYKVASEYDIDEVKESLRYDRRRLNKAWRVWKSDNPDWELEQDTEEE